MELDMSKPEVKYRRKLSSEQLEVLELLFRYRFGTNEQFARYFGKQTGKAVQKRLTILLEQGYIDKRYDGSYKLQGRPAEYHLLPNGARLLKGQQGKDSNITDQAIKNLYKDKTVSSAFIAHNLAIFTVSLKLRSIYGDKLDFFTKPELNAYSYFLRPLADGYISMKTSKSHKRYYVEVYEDDVPFFVLVRRIKKYFKYVANELEDEDQQRPDDNFPAILMITQSVRRQTQLRRRIAREVRETYEEDIVFATDKDKVWQVVDENKTMKALHNIRKSLD
jgi:hypothetical protein